MSQNVLHILVVGFHLCFHDQGQHNRTRHMWVEFLCNLITEQLEKVPRHQQYAIIRKRIRKVSG